MIAQDMRVMGLKGDVIIVHLNLGFRLTLFSLAQHHEVVTPDAAGGLLVPVCVLVLVVLDAAFHENLLAPDGDVVPFCSALLLAALIGPGFSRSQGEPGHGLAVGYRL